MSEGFLSKMFSRAMATLLQIRGLSKSFQVLKALDSVSFDVEAGSCHGIMGENGAGKSTLMKILAGIFPHDDGEILLHGQKVHFRHPADAAGAGIGIVHQELNLVSGLTVAENLYLGREPRRWHFLRDRRQLAERTQEHLRKIGIRLDPQAKVGELSAAQRQLVEIAKTLAQDPQILIFDEPTSSLSNAETKVLYDIIADLKARGATILYISHRMREIFDLCDHISVLRDGRHVATGKARDLTEEALVRQMVGRDLKAVARRGAAQPRGDVVLEVRELSDPARYQNISFSLRAGEIVGFAGLIGAGRSELAAGIFGAVPAQSGTMTLRGRPFQPRGPAEAMRAGVALVPEDRKLEGLVLTQSIRENLVLAVLSRLAVGPFRRFTKERAVAAHWTRQLSIKSSGDEQAVGMLSGGNQQKVLLAKWLATRPALLILDEPTRGVDVATKAEIYILIRQLADEGMALMVISSDMPELMTVSDRILVMCEGSLAGEIDEDEATEEAVMVLAAQTSSKTLA